MMFLCVNYVYDFHYIYIYMCVFMPMYVDMLAYQVSQVYQTVEFKRFASLVPFADKFRLEGLIVSAAKSMELQVGINYVKVCMFTLYDHMWLWFW